jgi:predicted TIM-barrel fold metal-dependent hydrolase
MRFQRAAVLGMAIGLPFGDHLTSSGWTRSRLARDRSLRSVRLSAPRDAGWRAKLAAFAARGARRELHRDDALRRMIEAMEIYAECERLGLPVIFHAGRSASSPSRSGRTR